MTRLAVIVSMILMILSVVQLAANLRLEGERDMVKSEWEKTKEELFDTLRQIETDRQALEGLDDLLPEHLSTSDRLIFKHAIYDAERNFKVHRALILETIERESWFDKDARGKAGEIGPMQVKPETAQLMIDLNRLKIRDLTDPYENIQVGTAYLAYLIELGKCERKGYLYGHASEKADKE